VIVWWEKATEKLFNFNVLNQAVSTNATSADLLKKPSLLRREVCGQFREAIGVSICPQFFHRLAQL